MSVFCGYCGKRGHNKLGCPERKKYARENPDSWLAHEVALEERQRAQRVASRTCTYCGKKGHNRRGCKTLQEDTNRIAYRSRQYKNQFLEAIESVGLSVGALIEVDNTSSYSESRWQETSLMMIQNYCWDDITFIAQDELESLGWSSWYQMPVLQAIVLNVSGIKDNEKWRFPKLNDTHKYTLRDLIHLLPTHLFSKNINRLAEEEPDSTKSIRIISPVYADGSQQEILDKHLKNGPIPESVKRTFHLVHDRRETDRYYKERLHLDNGLWRNIYPDEWDDKEKRMRP
ncbi:MAG TPA: hypothetical protein DCM40_09715 [Maribacter sp.]|nr:hypothetical protein [Maribacter sp.]